MFWLVYTCLFILCGILTSIVFWSLDCFFPPVCTSNTYDAGLPCRTSHSCSLSLSLSNAHTHIFSVSFIQTQPFRKHIAICPSLLSTTHEAQSTETMQEYLYSKSIWKCVWTFTLAISTVILWSLPFPSTFVYLVLFLPSVFFPCYVYPAISYNVISMCQGIMERTCHSPTCFLFMTWLPRENKLRYTPSITHYPLFTRIHPFTLVPHILPPHHTHSHALIPCSFFVFRCIHTPSISTTNHLRDHLPLDP